jgi:hypothetical protein
MQERTGGRLNKVDIAILDAEFIGSSSPRSNSTGATDPHRNARLAATHRLFSDAALRHAEHAELIARVLVTPFKHGKQTVVSYRNDAEISESIRQRVPVSEPHYPHLCAPRRRSRSSVLDLVRCPGHPARTDALDPHDPGLQRHQQPRLHHGHEPRQPARRACVSPSSPVRTAQTVVLSAAALGCAAAVAFALFAQGVAWILILGDLPVVRAPAQTTLPRARPTKR